jgi:hypothetical protein
MAKRKKWNHTQMCTSCQQAEAAPDFVYRNGQSGCKHYRGGKTATKQGKRYSSLEV